MEMHSVRIAKCSASICLQPANDPMSCVGPEGHGFSRIRQDDADVNRLMCAEAKAVGL